MGQVYEEKYLAGVRKRRLLSCLLDLLISMTVSALLVTALILIRIQGVIPEENITQELFINKWKASFFSFIYPAFVIYVARYLAYKPNQTVGMKIFSIKMEKMDGSESSKGTIFMHPILLVCIALIASPLMLTTFFSKYKRLPHDFLLGTIFVRSDVK